MSGLQIFLTERAADADTIHQAMRTYTVRKTDFMSEEQMRKRLAAVMGDAELARALHALEQDATLLESASLAVLSDAWVEPKEQDGIRRAVEGAKTKMPVIEVSVLAIVAMYGMYLATTGSKRSTETVRRQSADGSFETIERTSFYGPSGPLSSIVALFKAKAAPTE